MSTVDFATMMRLEPHGPDTFVGIGPRYPWGGLYGGQIVAQGLRAAAATVDREFRVHSLHAYFIRRGDQDEPIRFEVDRLRNGRSFVTRAVVARQAVGAILNMSASFQRDEPARDVQSAPMPDVPGPDEVAPTSWTPLFDRRWAVEHRPDGHSSAWLRLASTPGDDVEQACALAYLSDDIPTDAVVALHPDRSTTEPDGWLSASLDHAIWFHRPVQAERWHLHDFQARAFLSSRGLAVGRVFSEDGTHVATVTQEVLLRRRRDG